MVRRDATTFRSLASEIQFASIEPDRAASAVKNRCTLRNFLLILVHESLQFIGAKDLKFAILRTAESKAC